MGLAYKTSKWLDRLWSEHLESSERGRTLVGEGVSKQGEGFAGFPADLHARLYLPNDPEVLDDVPEWASQLHELAGETAEWSQLRLMCARNGFAAGIATEVLLEQLLPHVPELQKDDDKPASDLRAALRKAARAARDAVQDAEAGMEGLASPLGMSSPGSAVNPNTDVSNLKAVREAHAKLAKSSRLKRICELAGRLERLAVNKQHSRVKPGVGEVHGVEIGGDVARLLPSELVGLCRPRLKLALLAKLVEHRALTYGMTGRETQAKGPVVVLLDESSSMRDDGKDVWSKAVALALLSTATKQKRAWHLVAFSGEIHREVEIPPGTANSETITNALDRACSGGTDFDAPVLRAVQVICSSKIMKQADVVVITDGEDTLEPATVEAVTTLTQNEGVSWFVVAIGTAGDQNCAKSLGSIATSMVHVSALDGELVVPVINLEK